LAAAIDIAGPLVSYWNWWELAGVGAALAAGLGCGWR
jgi:hypothetical protein